MGQDQHEDLSGHIVDRNAVPRFGWRRSTVQKPPAKDLVLAWARDLPMPCLVSGDRATDFAWWMPLPPNPPADGWFRSADYLPTADRKQVLAWDDVARRVSLADARAVQVNRLRWAWWCDIPDMPGRAR